MFSRTPIAQSRAMSSSVVPPASRSPPVSEEKVVASAAAFTMSAYRLNTQNPSPPGVWTVGGGGEPHRRFSPQVVEHVVGKPGGEPVQVGQVDVVVHANTFSYRNVATAGVNPDFGIAAGTVRACQI